MLTPLRHPFQTLVFIGIRMSVHLSKGVGGLTSVRYLSFSSYSLLGLPRVRIVLCIRWPDSIFLYWGLFKSFCVKNVLHWPSTQDLINTCISKDDLSFIHTCFILTWLIDYLLFYVPLKYFSLIWRSQHCRWRAVKFRPILGAYGL
jgi:hypothetical protein